MTTKLQFRGVPCALRSEKEEAIVFLFTLLTGAVATDLRKHRIYNRWVFPGGVLGLLGAFAAEGGAGVKRALLAALLAFLLLFPVYLIGGIGAGDVKLFAAAATFLNMREVTLCILLSFLIGAGFSLVRIAAARSVHQTIRFAVPILISVMFLFGGKL